MGFHLTTARGYDFIEATSALQKEIRRGKEENALFWALELASKFDEYLWSRLAIIASEDIGPADSSVAVLIHALDEQYWVIKKRTTKPAEGIILSHAIIALCRAPKTRAADDLFYLTAQRIAADDLRLEVPEYALDFHTRRGKQKGRRWDHWLNEGCRLEHAVANPYRDRALAMRKKYGRLPAKTTEPRRRRARSDEKKPGELF